MRSLLLAASNNAWMARQATRRRFVRRAVSRFMPGESLEDALAAARRLRDMRIGAILTYLGENITDESEAQAVVRRYFEAIDRIQAERLDAEVSVKFTQLGLDLRADLALEHTRCIARRAAACGQRLWIDMESTAYTDVTLDLFRRLRADGADVGVALQAYLKRTRDDLESLLPLGGSVRIVKGAYREPGDRILTRKRDVDENFYALCGRMLEEAVRRSGARLTIATHDRRLIRRIEADAASRSIPRDAFEFAMLYGIQSAEQARLAADGYRVRVLISYGSHWFAWYMRRLAERPANVWFVVRNALGG
ncbi:MAG: proline dehydrogenase [Candidatus Rokuibacteriota bacterium]|nr:MAG: proline dehydrogenase [Candidatus Rokubacteria bacterium]